MYYEKCLKNSSAGGTKVYFDNYRFVDIPNRSVIGNIIFYYDIVRQPSFG